MKTSPKADMLIAAALVAVATIVALSALALIFRP